MCTLLVDTLNPKPERERERDCCECLCLARIFSVDCFHKIISFLFYLVSYWSYDENLSAQFFFATNYGFRVLGVNIYLFSHKRERVTGFFVLSLQDYQILFIIFSTSSGFKVVVSDVPPC